MAAKNKNKTKETAVDPIAFIDKVTSDVKRRSAKLGKHKAGKGVLYHKLDDVDRGGCEGRVFLKGCAAPARETAPPLTVSRAANR
jgi:hypothetical protein